MLNRVFGVAMVAMAMVAGGAEAQTRQGPAVTGTVRTRTAIRWRWRG